MAKTLVESNFDFEMENLNLLFIVKIILFQPDNWKVLTSVSGSHRAAATLSREEHFLSFEVNMFVRVSPPDKLPHQEEL